MPPPNNLLRFLRAISPRTKSLLLATATPAQLHPVEAYDLLVDSSAISSISCRSWRLAFPRLGSSAY